MYHPQPLTKEEAEAVFKVLVEEAGAPPSIWFEFFLYETTTTSFPTEFRFMGHLGFGGKFWNNSSGWYVNCYREDLDTGDRRAIIDRTNARLKTLQEDMGIDAFLRSVPLV